MLVLASASPRRRDLLAQAGYTFTVLPAHICEDAHPGEQPIPYVLRLARQKAEAVAASPECAALAAQHPTEPVLILGADTTVVAPNGEMLAKPESDADAARMLRLLAGATHQVITGVALVGLGPGAHTEVAAEVTHVTFLSPTDDEIAGYIATGEPQGKAGAYAIQGQAARWIPRVHGCYFNVVGLPLALVASLIAGVEDRFARTQDFERSAMPRPSC
jgi:septum formation protein